MEVIKANPRIIAKAIEVALTLKEGKSAPFDSKKYHGLKVFLAKKPKFPLIFFPIKDKDINNNRHNLIGKIVYIGTDDI